MTQAQLTDQRQPVQADLKQYEGRFRVTKNPESFPRLGSEVTIKVSDHEAQIIFGSPLLDVDRSDATGRLTLSGSLDAATGSLKGDYDDQHIFELLLGRRGGARRLTCVVKWNRQGSPSTSSWDADEEGP